MYEFTKEGAQGFPRVSGDRPNRQLDQSGAALVPPRERG